jgi:hypothetical protein
MKTDKKLIDEFVFEENQFKTVAEAQRFIRKNGAPDYIAIGNILYTMEEYDMSGKELIYYNKRFDKAVYVQTANRYKLGFGDANLEIVDEIGRYRQGFFYAE